ncbi:hypothetical protein CJD36_016770 [Flavipsychrobacter stenotrophus]|uniref:Uncharacterized protein n=1 Tax=Flavipsychrobacter stenotrophus TaxID=2077091 RepID=A0A2S7SRQ7_9BACT|nr:hypothetical protein [Flavipsychrobacter stenotrophus]PQJ09592.1 hypothetical protein CJD36_016770 [Flavipsychrobacter stenotrophus]
MEANEQVLAFIKNNPNTNKVAISDATGIKGLPLFNILKKLQTEQQITSQGEGPDMTFSAVVEETPAGDNETPVVIEPIVPIVTPSTEETADKQNVTEDKAPLEEKKEEPVAKVTSTRNKDKYIFNAEEYGKGPLVRTVVAQYMIDHPSTTFKQLKEKFPDTLMKRFGVFEEMAKAKELSGTRDRYFFKSEHLIKTADKKTLSVCSQWTAGLIGPFLDVARKLGYDIS